MLDLLSETGKLRVKPCSSLMAHSLHLTREGKLFGDRERYRRLVGNVIAYIYFTYRVVIY